jgi:Ca2+/Na+ antiporter
MMKENKIKPFYPIMILFIALTTLFIAGRSLLESWKIDQQVLLAGNLVLFIATLLSCLVSQKGINAKTGQGAVRGVYGSFMIKFFLCLGAAFIYIMMAKKEVNKPALFICMGLYIVYTILEVSILTKLSSQKKNA